MLISDIAIMPSSGPRTVVLKRMLGNSLIERVAFEQRHKGRRLQDIWERSLLDRGSGCLWKNKEESLRSGRAQSQVRDSSDVRCHWSRSFSLTYIIIASPNCCVESRLSKVGPETGRRSRRGSYSSVPRIDHSGRTGDHEKKLESIIDRISPCCHIECDREGEQSRRTPALSAAIRQ